VNSIIAAIDVAALNRNVALTPQNTTSQRTPATTPAGRAANPMAPALNRYRQLAPAVGLFELRGKRQLRENIFSWYFHCFSLCQLCPLGIDTDNPVLDKRIGSENDILALKKTIDLASSNDNIKRPRRAILS